MQNFFKRAKGYIERHLVALLFNIKNIWLCMSRPCIIVNAWVDDHWYSGVRTRNFGDDINKYFIESLTNRKVIFDHTFSWWGVLRQPNYLCIGSIIESHCNNAGSPYISGHSTPCSSKYLRVRGPRTAHTLSGFADNSLLPYIAPLPQIILRLLQ